MSPSGEGLASQIARGMRSVAASLAREEADQEGLEEDAESLVGCKLIAVAKDGAPVRVECDLESEITESLQRGNVIEVLEGRLLDAYSFGVGRLRPCPTRRDGDSREWPHGGFG